MLTTVKLTSEDVLRMGHDIREVKHTLNNLDSIIKMTFTGHMEGNRKESKSIENRTVTVATQVDCSIWDEEKTLINISRIVNTNFDKRSDDHEKFHVNNVEHKCILLELIAFSNVFQSPQNLRKALKALIDELVDIGEINTYTYGKLNIHLTVKTPLTREEIAVVCSVFSNDTLEMSTEMVNEHYTALSDDVSAYSNYCNTMMTVNDALGILFTPTDGYLWAEFLQQKLNNDGFNIKTILLDLKSASNHRCYETNIILASPDLCNLHYVDAFCKFNSKRTMVVLLGVTKLDMYNFLHEHKCSELLKVIFFETQQTEDSVNDLLYKILKLYNQTSEEETEMYVNRLQRIPLYAEVSQTPTNGIDRVTISLSDTDFEVYILCYKKGSDEIQIELHDDNRQIKAFHDNKAVYKFSVERDVAKTAPRFIAKDGTVIIGTGQIVIPQMQYPNIQMQKITSGSRLDILQEILCKECDPVSVMCQALEIEERTRKALDMNLAKKCHISESLPIVDSVSFKSVDPKGIGHSNKVWPTLMHFAAEFNLPHLCEELLKFPWSLDTCLIINKNGEMPIDIANRKSFFKVSKLLTKGKSKILDPGNKDSAVGDYEFDSVDDFDFFNRDSSYRKDNTDFQAQPPLLRKMKRQHIRSEGYSSMSISSYQEQLTLTENISMDRNLASNNPVGTSDAKVDVLQGLEGTTKDP